MAHTCCIRGCQLAWNPHSLVTFHSFPLKKEKLLEKWLRVIPSNTKVSKHSWICSNHFPWRSISLVNGRTYLKKDSVPTIFEHNVIQQSKENSYLGEANIQYITTAS